MGFSHVPPTSLVDLLDVGRAVQAELERQALTVSSTISRASHRANVHPDTVRFVLLHPSSGWPVLRPRDKELLEATVRLWVSFGTVSADNPAEMIDDATQERVDLAISDLVLWTRTELAPSVRRGYLSVLRRMCGDGANNDDVLALLEDFEAWIRLDNTLPTRRSMARILEVLF